jgi:tetratricopeptide (TPR) repeat protein
MSIKAGRMLPSHIGKIAICICATLHASAQERSLDYLVEEGQSHEAHGEFAEAERLFLEALHDAEQSPSNPLVVAGLLVNLAAVDTEEARYLDAERLLLRALALAERVTGVRSLAVASILWHLIGVYADAGHLAQANPLLRRYEAMADLSLGSDSLESAKNLGNLGRIYLARNDSRKALPLFQKAVDIVERNHAGNEVLIRALLDRAAAYSNLGHIADALADVDRAAAIVATLQDPTPQVEIDLQVTEGIVYSQAGLGTQAESSLKAALQRAESHYGPNHPVVAFVLRNCDAILRKFGKKQEASRDRERAKRIMAANEGAKGLGNSINAFVH